MALISILTAAAGVAWKGWDGVVGNAEYAAIRAALPAIQHWYRGAGQPVNHHLQRALRAAYLAATRRLLDQNGAYALRWLEVEEEKLKDPKYQPPEPPGGWEPAFVVDPTLPDVAGAVAQLRLSLERMLRSEWAGTDLGDPPAPVSLALAEGWVEPGSTERVFWFGLLSAYFNAALNPTHSAESEFVTRTLAKLLGGGGLILSELRTLGEKIDGNRAAAPPFYAPSAPDYFVGRVAAHHELRERLRADGSVAPLIGMPGLGKTSLALQFAHDCAADFEGVFWIDCAGLTLDAASAELARQLGMKADLPPEHLAPELRHRCAQRHYLLVLDNVSGNEVGLLLPAGRAASIVTTQRRDLPFLSRRQEVNFGLLTPDECVDLFRKYLGDTAISGRESRYRDLAEAMERLPLALAVAAGLLKHDVHYTLDKLLREPKLHKLEHAGLKLGLLGTAIASASEPARELLAAMAVCAPSGFRRSLAAEIAGMEEGASLDALQDLRSRSLVEELDREAGRYRLHSLIRAAAGQDAAGQGEALRQRHAEAVAQRFRQRQTNWRECEEDLPDWRLARDWALLEKASRVATLTSLLDSGFGLTYNRGLMAEALAAMRTAETALAELGDRAGLQRSYGNQALILQAWGRLEEAMALHKRQEAISEELGDRAGLQASYGNQALILQDWGRLEEAMALHKREEAICEELGDRAGLQASYGNQALILQAWGRLEEAMALHKRKEAICEELGDRAGLQRSYGNQALILKDWGRLEDAMALLKRQEAICERLGDRAGLQRSYGNQALILQAWGRLEEAMALLKRQEAICEELGDRAGLQASYGNQALILKAWGRLEEAMALLKRKEVICRELGLRDSLRISLHNQAILLEQTGRPEDTSRARAEAEAIQAEIMRGRDAAASG